MSAYVTETDMIGRMGQAGINAATSDDGTGVLNTAVLNSIITSASAMVDMKLALLYAVPFNPVPPAVFSATLSIACYMVQARALTPKERNIFADEYDDAMKFLNRVADGKIGLDQTTSRAFSPAFFAGECLSTWGTTA
jgi:phage gp36-like protein